MRDAEELGYTSDLNYLIEKSCSDGWTCPDCRQWVPSEAPHVCYGPPDSWTYVRSNAEESSSASRAFRVLKRLFEEKIIDFPESFEEFKRILKIIESEIS